MLKKTVHAVIFLAKSIEERLSMFLLATIVVLVFFSALARAVGEPNPWSVDLSQTLFAWFALATASYTWRKNAHIGVDFFYNKLPLFVRNVVDILNLIFIAIFLGIISTYSVILSFQNWERLLSSLPISYSFITISVGLWGYAMFITTLDRLYRRIRAYFTTPDERKSV